METRLSLLMSIHRTKELHRSVINYQKLGREVVVYTESVIASDTVKSSLVNNLKDLSTVLQLRLFNSSRYRRTVCILQRVARLVTKAVEFMNDSSGMPPIRYDVLEAYLNRACISLINIRNSIKHDIHEVYKTLACVKQ
jgi:hypothetical protein